jgi:uncharacterized protein YjbI with pentapeptide repeats
VALLTCIALKCTLSTGDATADAASALLAAHALSVLSGAGLSFSGMDLSSVRVPGADLSNAVLADTCFNKADLRGVKFW